MGLSGQELVAIRVKADRIPLFRDNAAAFIHDRPPDAIANAAGASNYVRVQVLTPVAVLDRGKQLGVVKELTEIVPPPPATRLGAFGAGPRPVAPHRAAP